MEANYGFVLFASIAAAVFGFVSASRGIQLYGTAKPPKAVLDRIKETRKPLSCKAHVLSTAVSRTGTTLSLTVNVLALPSHVNSTFFVLDELYINLQGNSIIPPKNDEELLIEESQNKELLARLPLISTSNNGYRAIKMRGVFASWCENNRKSGFLKLILPSTQTQLATNLESSEAYFVIYALTGPLHIGNVVSCDSYDVIIKPQAPMNAAFTTKICSPPDDITFPFNASKYFDMGAALRKSMKDSPVPISSAVFRNPKCCHATKAVSRMFVGFNPSQQRLQIDELENVEITECSCAITN